MLRIMRAAVTRTPARCEWIMVHSVISVIQQGCSALPPSGVFGIIKSSDRAVIGTSFNGRTPRSGRGYWGSNPCVPATSHFARQTTVLHAFASVSNALFGGPPAAEGRFVPPQPQAPERLQPLNFGSNPGELLPVSRTVAAGVCNVRARGSRRDGGPVLRLASWCSEGQADDPLLVIAVPRRRWRRYTRRW